MAIRMTSRTHCSDIYSYRTKDDSEIRELMLPKYHGNQNQSLAEAIVNPGLTTHKHLHKLSEELYHITQGQGMMFLDDEQFEVSVGDTLCIKPGTPHHIKNTGTTPLHILCMCSPPYSHDDTELL